MAVLTLAASAAVVNAAVRPNIVFLLVDDMGWNGVRCYGSDFHETPNIDALAKSGARFTSAYAACTVCSPSRAAILTGKYPARLHLTDWIAGQYRPFAMLRVPDWTQHLELSEVTIAEALQQKGYRTAHVGKWHLGGPEYYPEHQGFDVNIAGTLAGSPPGGYFLPNRLNLPGAKRGDYLTDRLTDEVLQIIDRFRDDPFFIYFAYYAVHTPIQGKPELVAHYRSRVDRKRIHHNPTYAAMVQSVDESVGRILRKLTELGLEKRTIIFFTSDNGGLSHRNGKPTGITDNSPLRRGKGSSFEGGHRVPLILRWPGVTRAGAEVNEPVHGIDFYPTILEMTGARGDPRHNATVDGVSLVPLLRGRRWPNRALFWHYPHYHAGGDGPYGAVRQGRWKLMEWYEDMSVALYDLRKDIGEKRDLSKAKRDKAAEMRRLLHSWRESVGAQMPSPNPNYDPKRAREGPRHRKPPRRKGKSAPGHLRPNQSRST